MPYYYLATLKGLKPYKGEQYPFYGISTGQGFLANDEEFKPQPCSVCGEFVRCWSWRPEDEWWRFDRDGKELEPTQPGRQAGGVVVRLQYRGGFDTLLPEIQATLPEGVTAQGSNLMNSCGGIVWVQGNLCDECAPKIAHTIAPVVARYVTQFAALACRVCGEEIETVAHLAKHAFHVIQDEADFGTYWRTPNGYGENYWKIDPEVPVAMRHEIVTAVRNYRSERLLFSKVGDSETAIDAVFGR